ncbi:MAG: 50S ribosomal protein L6 [Pseudomonadota bacterium]|nr:50S ribosomal protein L6 [Pseudomonadota bacterium]
MSRVAKDPIVVPEGVQVDIEDQHVTVKKGSASLNHSVHDTVVINQTDAKITFHPANGNDWALAGTSRALVANMVHGVHVGFTKELELVGVGYRVKQEGRTLVFTLGYSHPINFPLPDNVDATIEKQTKLTLKSIDKQLVGQTAANIHRLRQPDAYKGKGVRMVGVQLKLKEVKKK